MGIESKIEADLRARNAEDGFLQVDDMSITSFEVPERGRATWEVWVIALLVGAAAMNALLLFLGVA
ncbi:hypothetical protein ACWPMX_00035 [Tsuneonella sp. HG094]